MGTRDSLDEDIAAALSGLALSDEEDSTTDEDTPDAEEAVETPDEDEQPEDDAAEEETEEDAEDSDEDAEDEEDSEDDDAEDDEEGDDEDDPLTLDDDTVIVLPDGTEVTGADVKGGILRQKDYTRKTQELAQMREQVQEAIDAMETWYQEKSEDPASWITEIAAGTPDAHETIAQAVAGSGNPNVAFASITKTLVESGALDERLVERLGLTEIAKQASSSASEDRVARLEREWQEREEARAAEQAQQEALAELDRQWSEIVTKEGLEFQSDQEAEEAQVELYQFMLDHEIPRLDVAWDALARRQARTAPAAPAPKPAKKRSQEAVQRKRRAAAVNRKSTGGKKLTLPPAADTDEAAERAYESLFGGQ